MPADSATTAGGDDDGQAAAGEPGIALSSSAGRWLLVATILGSGTAFLDGSVVNVALPTIGRELGGGFTVLQWVLDGYLLTLSTLLLLGGALGDRYGRRRIFAIGLVAFTLASLGCGSAPNGVSLVSARIVQGIGGALLVPGSLSLINVSVRQSDRGRAIGRWAGLTGIAAALGPLVGGWLVEVWSWRLVFFINPPIAAGALWVTLRHVPESRDEQATGRPDISGSAAVTIGLAGLVYALIEGPSRGWSFVTIIAAVIGVAGLVVFLRVESRRREPLLPLDLFSSRQFSGANVTTLAVYAALGGALFLLTLRLQDSMAYTALRAGLATIPITIIMLLLSSRMGALAQRVGPRVPMTIGPLVTGTGLALLTLARPGASYQAGVLPGVLVFGLGLAITVAPLTSAVLWGIDERHVGAASGVNNAVSRVAGLLAVAILPVIAGGGSGPSGDAIGSGFGTAMLVAAVLCGLGGLVAWFTISAGVPVADHPLPGVNQACQQPCTREPGQAVGGGQREP
jgi:EmrB/QacA subfamily drug resistance transporter